MLKNKCCLYVIISIRFFSITICNLLIEFPSYIQLRHKSVVQQVTAKFYICKDKIIDVCMLPVPSVLFSLIWSPRNIYRGVKIFNLLVMRLYLASYYFPSWVQNIFMSRLFSNSFSLCVSLTLILRRFRMGTVWFYTSTSNKRAARPKLYTKSLTRDLKRMYSRLTLVRISINL